MNVNILITDVCAFVAIPTDTQFILLSLHVREKLTFHANLKTNLKKNWINTLRTSKNFYLEKTEYVDNFLLPEGGVLKLDDIFIKPVITDVKRPKSATKNYFVQKKLAGKQREFVVYVFVNWNDRNREDYICS